MSILKDFRDALESNEWPELTQLTKDVEALATRFPTVGFEKAEGKYTQGLERPRRKYHLHSL